MNRTPIQLIQILRSFLVRRGLIFGSLFLLALLAFELFNYSTTDFALTDLLGSGLTFLGLRWATILSVAFCAIDFAGVARLFAPELSRNEPAEFWYLLGAWALAAAMNASLTWWGVAVAIRSHSALGAEILGRDTLLTGVPIFVAVMVWIIRILLIGTFSMSGERLFAQPDSQPARQLASRSGRPVSPPIQPAGQPAAAARTFTRGMPAARPEPVYHPLTMNARSRGEDEKQTTWR
jgi:hypothetical protein